MVRTRRNNGKGWHKESRRHSLARQGITTTTKNNVEARLQLQNSNVLFLERVKQFKNSANLEVYTTDGKVMSVGLKRGDGVILSNLGFSRQEQIKILDYLQENPKDLPNYKPPKKVKVLSERQKQNKFYEDYVIESIDSEGYDANPKTKKEKLQFLKDTFKSEYGHAIARQGEQKAFQEWMQGLPSSYNVEFYNNKILALAKKSGSLPQNATEKQEDRVIENYWNFMSVKTFQAFKKHGVK